MSTPAPTSTRSPACCTSASSGGAVPPLLRGGGPERAPARAAAEALEGRARAARRRSSRCSQRRSRSRRSTATRAAASFVAAARAALPPNRAIHAPPARRLARRCSRSRQLVGRRRSRSPRSTRLRVLTAASPLDDDCRDAACADVARCRSTQLLLKSKDGRTLNDAAFCADQRAASTVAAIPFARQGGALHRAREPDRAATRPSTSASRCSRSAAAPSALPFLKRALKLETAEQRAVHPGRGSRRRRRACEVEHPGQRSRSRRARRQAPSRGR